MLPPVFQAIEGVTPVAEGKNDSNVHRLAYRGNTKAKNDVIRGWEWDIRVAVAQYDSYCVLIGRAGDERSRIIGR